MGYSIYFPSDSSLEIRPPLPDTLVNSLSDELRRRHDEPGYPSIWSDLYISAGYLLFPDESCGGNIVGWVQWVLDKLRPSGHGLFGAVQWEGDDRDDAGRIVATGFQIKVYDASFTIEWVERT